MPKELTGSLSKNKKKEKEQHPDYRGSATIAGVDYWISGWANEGSDGKYLGLKFQQKDEQARPAKKASDDDDIPF
jgi:hypothetical protein